MEDVPVTYREQTHEVQAQKEIHIIEEANDASRKRRAIPMMPKEHLFVSCVVWMTAQPDR